MPQRRDRQNTARAKGGAAPSRGAGRRGNGSASASGRRGGASTGKRRGSGPASGQRGSVGVRGAGAPGDKAASPRRAGAHSARSVTPRVSASAGVEVKLPVAGEVLLTRRHFLYGVAGVAALALLGGGGYAASQLAASDNSDVTTLKVPTSSVFTTEDCTQIEDASTALALVSSQELPYGSLIWSNSDSTAVCLLPTETARPLAQVGLIALGSGTCTTVIEHAVGESEGFEIYDVRACDKGLIWTEADILEGTWRVYHARLEGASVGTPALAEEGASDWEMPTLAAAGGYAFWQTLPNLDGPAKQEDSTLKRAAFGSSDAEVVYASHGRMACAPCSVRDGVIAVPRADTSGTYYQLTRIEAESGQVTDALVLPSSMRPFEVGYGPTGFSFAFDGIYSYGDGIANLGTYLPTDEVTTGILSEDALAQMEGSSAGSASASSELSLAERNVRTAASVARFAAVPYGDATWFRFPRTPLAAPAWCGSWLMVKSTSAVCGVDLAARQYFSIEVENGADDYGDFLASTGAGDYVVTYSNIDHTPLSGERTRKCLVRVWKPA
ncbi:MULTISPECIES: Tat pathway signal protein [unclassified Adlercreutzia]|uniref:Tat pathway signal protein n=1 Tax=unclassified Adlercreutzia TaxID=2636013 RepID=UPI0013EE3EDC|nr:MULTISPECIES: Tat pathway signal protein [unclassified Adlercreutzia]